MPGMKDFKFICHQDANDAFAATQEEKELKMLPFLQQAKPNIGFHFPVYIWFEETIKKREYADASRDHARRHHGHGRACALNVHCHEKVTPYCDRFLVCSLPRFRVGRQWRAERICDA